MLSELVILQDWIVFARGLYQGAVDAVIGFMQYTGNIYSHGGA